MGKDLLNEFVRAGYLDSSVTEGFDPYYEPSCWRSDDGRVEDGDWGDYDEHGIGYDGQLVTWAY